MEDETGGGTFKWAAEPITVNPDPIHQQLLIDLQNAREENKQLREDLARAIEKANMSYSNFGVALLLSIVLSNAIWIAFSVAQK